MQETISREEEKISQELNDRIGQNPQFFQQLLNKTEDVSTYVYQKSPMKMDLIESNAKQIDQRLNKIVNVLDTGVQKTLQVYEQKRSSIVDSYQSQKQSLTNKFQNSTAYKKSNEYQNSLVNQLEGHLLNLGSYLLKREIGIQQQQLEGQNGQQEQVQNLILRYNQLWDNTQFIVKEISNQYFQCLQRHPVYAKYLEVKVFQEVAVDILMQNMINPINEGYVQPNYVMAQQKYNQIVQYAEVQRVKAVQYYQKSTNIAKQLCESMIVQVNLKCDLCQQQLQKVKPFLIKQYGVLKEGSVKVYNNYLTIQFCKEFYLQNQKLIVNTLNQIRTQIVENKDLLIQKSQQITNSTKNTYENALIEFRRRREEELNKIQSLKNQMILSDEVQQEQEQEQQEQEQDQEVNQYETSYQEQE